MKARLGFVIALMGPGLWGVPEKRVEYDVTYPVINIKGSRAPCVPPTYLKGLFRRAAERLSKPLGLKGLERVFGREGGLPPKAYFAPAVPVASYGEARSLFNEGELRYLTRGPGPGASSTLVTHVGIDDSSSTRLEMVLFTEERLEPVLMYFEVLLYDAGCDDLLAVLSPALLLNHSYVGRKTSGRVRLVGVEPAGLVEECGGLVKLVVDGLAGG